MEVRFEDVCYQNPNEKQLLNHISFTVVPKKVTVLMGCAGSGKSIISDLMRLRKLPSDGTIVVGPFLLGPKTNIEHCSGMYRLVGLVHQYPEKTFTASRIYDEIAFSMKQYQYKIDTMEQHILAALKMVGLDASYLNKNPFYLSLGEQKKVALATVLAYNPSVLVFDEPTVGLDSQSKMEWVKMIRQLKRKYHKTILILTRDSEFAIQLADEVLILKHGKIVLKGKKMEVFRQVKKLDRIGIAVPKTVLFSNKVFETKKIKMGYRDDINDLIKDVYRYAK